jgi:RND family efflux transporter MFP subunit
VFIGTVLFIQNGDTSAPFEVVRVSQGDVVRIVSVIGVLEPRDRVALAFPVGGIVANVAVSESEFVETNTELARLRDVEAQNLLREARATLALQQASYATLSAPVREEQRSVLDATVRQTEGVYQNAIDAGMQTLQSAYVDMHSAVYDYADKLFEGTDVNDPSFGVMFSVGTQSYVLNGTFQEKIELARMRRLAGNILERMGEYAYASDVDISEKLLRAVDDAQIIEQFLTRLAEVVNRYSSEDSAVEAVYDSYRTSVSSSRTRVSSTRQSLVNARNTLETARATLEKTREDRVLGVAGATLQDLQQAQENVRVTEEKVAVAESRLENLVLRAPYSGIVTRIDIVPGEVVAPAEVVGELLSGDVPQIEVYIPEADIRDMKTGNLAQVTFDTFERDEVFTAQVVHVAATETVREGVPTYKTTLDITTFPDGGEELVLRPGMTADIEIITGERRNVVIIPRRSVYRNESGEYVYVPDGKGYRVQEIVTGFRGSDGMIEVISGITEGDQVITYLPEEQR